MQLLMSLGRVLVRRGLKDLTSALPSFLPSWGNSLIEIAKETWEDYTGTLANRQAPAAPAENLRSEVEALVRDTPGGVRQKADEVAQRVAGDQPPEMRQALANYLVQVPAMIRRSLRRPSDPSGTTLTGNFTLRKGDDLVALLPPRPPLFKPGDRPLPGVDWVLDELLGVGGFGEVWKAHHAQLRGLPPVALKFCLDDQAAKALRNEAGVLDQVMQHGRHEGIVQLRQAYLQASPPCLEYEYIAGGDLAGLIQEFHQKGRPSAGVAGKIMRRLAEIIGSVHQQKPPIVHRDLKPANILVQKSPAGKFLFKVADFGIGQVTAREAILSSTRAASSRAVLLSTVVQGSYTPLYASPQQVRGDPPDPRDDVYSLGVIWYQLLTGDLGSGAPSGLQWSRDLAQRGMPQKQIDFLASCFESNPAHRPANAAVLAEQLSQLRADEGLVEVLAVNPPPPMPPNVKSTPEPARALPVPPPAPPPRLPARPVVEDIPMVEVVPINPSPPMSPAKSKPESVRGLPVPLPASPPRPPARPVVEDVPMVEVLPMRQASPLPPSAKSSEEARRRGEAAALWVLIAGIGSLAVTTSFIAAMLPDLKGEGIAFAFIIAVVFAVAGTFQFLASGSLKNFQGKGMVITAIVFGFVLGLLFAIGTVGGLVGIAGRGGTGVEVLGVLLISILCAALSFVNFSAAIRGIMVLNNPAVSREFSRPDQTREEHKPIFSKGLVIGLSAGLGGLFLVVLLIAISLKR
jgi:serine/threonine protein kinase